MWNSRKTFLESIFFNSWQMRTTPCVTSLCKMSWISIKTCRTQETSLNPGNAVLDTGSCQGQFPIATLRPIQTCTIACLSSSALFRSSSSVFLLLRTFFGSLPSFQNVWKLFSLTRKPVLRVWRISGRVKLYQNRKTYCFSFRTVCANCDALLSKPCPSHFSEADLYRLVYRRCRPLLVALP